MEATLTMSWGRRRRRRQMEYSGDSWESVACRPLWRDRHRKSYAHFVANRKWRAYERAFFRVLEAQVGVQLGPVTAEDDVQLEVLFLGNAAKWERETRYVSSMTDVVTHPSYEEIIKMGHAAPTRILSLLLRDMKENDRPWFTALATIAGTNPVNPNDAGRVDRMAKAWLNWGKKEGLL